MERDVDVGSFIHIILIILHGGGALLVWDRGCGPAPLQSSGA